MTPRAVLVDAFHEIDSDSFEVDPAEQHADNLIAALNSAGYAIIPYGDLAPLWHLYEAGRITGNMTSDTYQAALKGCCPVMKDIMKAADVRPPQ